MVFFAERHLSLRRIKVHAFHRLDERVGIGIAIGFFQGRYQGHCHRKTTCGEEVWRRLEFSHVAADEHRIEGISRNIVIVVSGAFHAGKIFVNGHCRQDVSPGSDFDAVAF